MGETDTTLVLVGFLVMLICQDIVAFKALRNNETREGMLCALIPGYLLVYGGKDRQAGPLLGWFAGLAMLLTGFVR